MRSGEESCQVTGFESSRIGPVAEAELTVIKQLVLGMPGRGKGRAHPDFLHARLEKKTSHAGSPPGIPPKVPSKTRGRWGSVPTGFGCSREDHKAHACRDPSRWARGCAQAACSVRGEGRASFLLPV